jgi:hypothetical protein
VTKEKLGNMNTNHMHSGKCNAENMNRDDGETTKPT